MIAPVPRPICWYFVTCPLGTLKFFDLFFFFTTNALWQRRRQQCDELLVKVLNDLHHITPSCCRLEFTGHCRRIAIVVSPKWGIVVGGGMRVAKGTEQLQVEAKQKQHSSKSSNHQRFITATTSTKSIRILVPPILIPPNCHPLPSLATPLCVHLQKIWVKRDLKLDYGHYLHLFFDEYFVVFFNFIFFHFIQLIS